MSSTWIQISMQDLVNPIIYVQDFASLIELLAWDYSNLPSIRKWTTAGSHWLEIWDVDATTCDHVTPVISWRGRYVDEFHLSGC